MPVVTATSPLVYQNEYFARHLERKNVVQAGLICYLDASIFNTVTFGSTWWDISGNGYHGTVNGATWLSDESGVVNFDGVNDFVNVPTPDLRYTDHTIMGTARYNTGGTGRLLSGDQNNWLMGHHGSAGTSTTAFYAESTVQTFNNGFDTNWRVYAFSGDYTNDIWNCYVNGSVTTANSSAGTRGPYGFDLGRYGPGANEYGNGRIANLLVYKRVLTAQEIAHNYTVLRYRVGL